MKALKTIYNIVTALILIVVIGLALLLVGVKFVGFTPYAVLSGSMEPLYDVGSVVYVKDVTAEDIEIGDVITFYMSNGSTVVTHQVIEIDEAKELYYTQGLANDTPDGQPTSINNIIGKVYFGIPYLGYISAYVTSPPWLYIIIAFVLMWLIIIYMIDTAKEGDKGDELSELDELMELEEHKTRRKQSKKRDRRR